MSITQETQFRLIELRRKAAEGTLTLDEMREGIRLLRQGRVSAAAASEGARKKRAKATPKSAEDLLSDLDSFSL
jgi:hypothetical protein